MEGRRRTRKEEKEEEPSRMMMMNKIKSMMKNCSVFWFFGSSITFILTFYTAVK